MVAIKTTFDGERIVLPEALRGRPPQEVIIVCETNESEATDSSWLKAQEQTFAKAWDNDEDAAYDSL